MSARAWASMGAVTLAVALTVGFATLPGAPLVPLCCLRRALLGTVATARPLCAMLLPLLWQLRKQVGL